MIGADFDQVLADAQAGDEAAFARLWRDLNPSLLRYLTLGGDLAEEVAAEAWATVAKGLRDFVGDETSWRAWVFTSARRRAIDLGRKRAREQGLGWRASTWASETARDTSEIVVDAMSTQDALALVRTLPSAQAEVVLLRIVGGLPVSDVADIVGRSEGAVRVSCHRGLAKLAQIMRESGVTFRDPASLRGVT